MPIIQERNTRPQINLEDLAVNYSTGKVVEIHRSISDYDGTKSQLEDATSILCTIAGVLGDNDFIHQVLQTENQLRNSSEIQTLHISSPSIHSKIMKQPDGKTRIIISSDALARLDDRRGVQRAIQHELIERSSRITVEGDSEQIAHILEHSFNPAQIKKNAEKKLLSKVRQFLWNELYKRCTALGLSADYNGMHSTAKEEVIFLFQEISILEKKMPKIKVTGTREDRKITESICCDAFANPLDEEYLKYWINVGGTLLRLKTVQSYRVEDKVYLFEVMMKFAVLGEIDLNTGNLENIHYNRVDISVKSLSKDPYSTPEKVFQQFLIELTGVPQEILSRGTFRPARESN